MKDVYELLNEVNIDENEIEEMEVSDFEKEKVKTNLRKAMKKNRKFKTGWKVAVAAGFLIVGGIVTIGVTNPAYASEIPVIGDIFRFLDGGRTGVYDKYKENASKINMSRECNGVTVTIKDAVFDGQTIIYTYEIKSDKDLGEKPFISAGGPILTIDGYMGGTGGGSITEKVGENTYIGQDNNTINKEMDEVNFKINIREISDMTSKEGEDKSVKGNWDFELSLKAVESEKKIINKVTEKSGIKAFIDSITETEMSCIINYSQETPKEFDKKWFWQDLDIEVRDDLGNVYKGEGNGGRRDADGQRFKWSKTFEKLDDKATKLIISPKMRLGNGGGGAKADENGNIVNFDLPIDENHPAHGEIVLDDIVIELDKGQSNK
ncbi:DUF4179 domain-containing protein [Clostridium sp. SHJSY1]|uniref:DUF4179 domain-containing protein n=1 Tax=Clostridium sp. SHJSY1 TaxID=2942483 RepID=UPI002874A9F0|nr:DUF4179 domain-containing protein [Clostridium sp. SHJSY1]MDS0527619.1 DUF4179 domain-containing protein [Clostridium sp. SHJSY1]